MDVVEKLSKRFCDELLPTIKWEVELAYVVFMVQQSVKSADWNWHKSNLFYSYVKALLYVRGADIIIALCTGASPVDAISCNCTLLTVAAVWWLVLFVPFDIFNRILNFETGDVRPLVILLALLATIRRVVAVDAAVTASLSAHEGSYIAVFLGTLAGNGTLAAAIVFGDFARNVSGQDATKLALTSALILTLSKILCHRVVTASVALTFCVLLSLAIQLAESLGSRVGLLDALYEILQKIVVTRDHF
ncbi:uncharacterized protein LOC143449555 [Clavelina lepadiformis]|uniref:Uncharacterized protein n=1 Tax=Clavelina lepadiformis TaxID=159417 RepID=A0ABP0GLZ3_CLALP